MAGSISKLRTTILVSGIPIAVVVIGAISYLTTRNTIAEMGRTISDGLIADGLRASAVISQYLRERRTDVEHLAAMPEVGVRVDSRPDVRRVPFQPDRRHRSLRQEYFGTTQSTLCYLQR